MSADLPGKFTCRGKSRMKKLTQRIVKSGDGDVIGHQNSRFLQRLIHARGYVIVTAENGSWTISIGQQGFHCKITEFTIIGPQLTEVRFQSRFFHDVPVPTAATFKPGNTLIANEPDIAV